MQTKINPSDIINAYKFILGRLPESEEIIKIRAEKATLEDLRGDLLLSVEFEKLYQNRDFALRIKKRRLKAAIKFFLKPKLVWMKFFIKKHPILFKAAKIVLIFFPERVKKRLRGLQEYQAMPKDCQAMPRNHLPHIDSARVKHIYDELNAVLSHVKDKR
ncbi:MAG: hypothetical protein LBP51_00400 [Deferribacteraceae bacterium]|nr:hypothetical protein [Deferribacteraceae bacterium]